MAGSISDITAGKVFDPLTGLPNRVLFMDRLEQEFAAYRANPAAQFAVMFLDIDRFKLINDSLGHAAGDRLLSAMAERLVRGVRTGDCAAPDSRDLVARVGGDEFAILLCDLARSGGGFAGGAAHLAGAAGTVCTGGQRHILYGEHGHRAVRPDVSGGGGSGAGCRYGDVHRQE